MNGDTTKGNVARGDTREVRNLEHASKTVREYIESNGLGSSQWTGTGRVKSDTGKTIAWVSYNGRIWQNNPNKMDLPRVELDYLGEPKVGRTAFDIAGPNMGWQQ